MRTRFTLIEEHHRCFGLGCYFMAAVLAAARYSRIGFSLYLSVRARHVRVPGGSVFHLEPVTINPFCNLTGTLLEPYWNLMSLMLSKFPENCIIFRFVIEGRRMFSAITPPV